MKETAARKCRKSSGLKEKSNTPRTPAHTHLPGCLSTLWASEAADSRSPGTVTAKKPAEGGDEGGRKRRRERARGRRTAAVARPRVQHRRLRKRKKEQQTQQQQLLVTSERSFTSASHTHSAPCRNDTVSSPQAQCVR